MHIFNAMKDNYHSTINILYIEICHSQLDVHAWAQLLPAINKC